MRKVEYFLGIYDHLLDKGEGLYYITYFLDEHGIINNEEFKEGFGDKISKKV